MSSCDLYSGDLGHGLKSNPRALEFIEELNAGLDEMREAARWYDSVASSLKKRTRAALKVVLKC